MIELRSQIAIKTEQIDCLTVEITNLTRLQSRLAGQLDATRERIQICTARGDSPDAILFSDYNNQTFEYNSLSRRLEHMMQLKEKLLSDVEILERSLQRQIWLRTIEEDKYKDYGYCGEKRK